MREELYKKKYQYESFIKTLNSNYEKIEKCLSILVLCKKRIKNNVNINDECFDVGKLDDIIKNIESDKNKISNIILPQARYEYNNILFEISKL